MTVSYSNTMKWITLFAFFSLIFGCWAPDPEDKDLKPLNIPEEIEMDDDRTSLMNIFRTFNINYLRSKFKPPSKEASISQRLWSTASQFVDTYKALYRTDKFPNACDWSRVGLKRSAKVTKEGDKQCSDKCKEQNEDYVKFVNNRLPQLFGILNMPHLKAKFEATDEDIHECAPGFVYGFTCVCKGHVKAFVNEELQELIDEVFDVENEKKDDGENAEEKKESQNKSNVAGRFLGLFFILMYFPSWLYSYIVWWAYVNKQSFIKT